MISPFIGTEYESSLWPPRTTADTTFLSTRAEKEARELLKQSYEIIKELDDNLDDIVRSYDFLEEELFEIRKLIPSQSGIELNQRSIVLFSVKTFFAPQKEVNITLKK